MKAGYVRHMMFFLTVLLLWTVVSYAGEESAEESMEALPVQEVMTEHESVSKDPAVTDISRSFAEGSEEMLTEEMPSPEYDLSGTEDFQIDEPNDELIEEVMLDQEDERITFDPEDLQESYRLLPPFTIPDQVYTGEPLTPEVVIYDGDTLLMEGIDYTDVVYDHNVETGAATVTARGIGRYFGTSEATFMIREDKDYELPDEIPFKKCGFLFWNYGRQIDYPFVTIPGLDDEEYEVVYPERYDRAETVTVTVIGKGNYAGKQKDYEVVISPMVMSDDLGFSMTGVNHNGYCEYTGEEICPSWGVYYDTDDYDPWAMFGEEFESKITWYYFREGRDFTVTYENNVEPGIATAIIRGTGNLTGERRHYFRIARKYHIRLEMDPGVRIDESRVDSALSWILKDGFWVYEGQSLGDTLAAQKANDTDDPDYNPYQYDNYYTGGLPDLYSVETDRLFLGWSLDPEAFEPIDPVLFRPHSDLTLYARWDYAATICLCPYEGGPLEEVKIREGDPIYTVLPTDYCLDGTTWGERVPVQWNTKPDGTGKWAENLRATQIWDGAVFYAIPDRESSKGNRIVKITLKTMAGYYDHTSYGYDTETGEYSTIHNVSYEEELNVVKGRTLEQHLYWGDNIALRGDDILIDEDMTLAGWSLSPNGELLDWETFYVNEDTTLYAVFKPCHKVAFGDEEEWGRVFQVADGTRLGESLSYWLDMQGWLEAREGYLERAVNSCAQYYSDKRLNGWKNTLDGRVYSAGEVLDLTVTTDLTFAPVLEEAYPVTLHANGMGWFWVDQGHGCVASEQTTVNSACIAEIKPAGQSYGSKALGVWFAGYGNTPDGEVRDFQNEPITGPTDLYAIWKKPVTVFWMSGGILTSYGSHQETLLSGSHLPRIKNPVSDFAVPFLGWSLTRNGPVLTEEEYANLIVTEDMRLYAVWDIRLEDDGEEDENNNNHPPVSGADGVWSGAGDTAEDGQKAAADTASVFESLLDAVISEITSGKQSRDFEKAAFLPLRLKAAAVSKSEIRLSWKAAAGKSEYLVFGAKIGQPMKLLAQGSSTTFRHKKLKKGTYYRYVVIAKPGTADGEQAPLVSKTVYAVTKGGRYANEKRIRVSSRVLKLKTGVQKKLKAMAAAPKKMKKICGIRFESSDPNIAYVDRNGKIRARRKGTCRIWVFTQSGLAIKVKVKVGK